MAKSRRRFARLEAQLVRLHPQLKNALSVIKSGLVHVNGVVITNPDSLVPLGASIIVREPPSLRGEAKLAAALETFTVPVAGRVALDVGASAGGFTRVLLVAGARCVYAVDAGHGQLLGSLRQDSRVINLEGVNVGELDRAVVPDRIEVITIDLSYLSLARAVPQLEGLDVAPDANLVALVKPMFELGLPRPPTDPPTLRRAVDLAIEGIEACPWRLADEIQSPIRGRRGAVEFLVHAQRIRNERRCEEQGRG